MHPRGWQSIARYGALTSALEKLNWSLHIPGATLLERHCRARAATLKQHWRHAAGMPPGSELRMRLTKQFRAEGSVSKREKSKAILVTRAIQSRLGSVSVKERRAKGVRGPGEHKQAHVMRAPSSSRTFEISKRA
ncbi:unnamed protein product, partial [Polarella glacialis]